MKLHWGILGTGNIARQFVEGVAHAHRGRVLAVASRDPRTAGDFAAQFNLDRSYGSYDALLDDPAVEAVYVSLPNSLHHEWTIKALQAGKHVLCEKPIAASAQQAQEMFDTAQRCGRVLMEGFMYRCHPLTQRVLEAVRSGAIGPVRLIRTSFCFRARQTQGNIRFSAALAGGSLMDVGCYCLSLSRLVAGCEPDQAHATGHVHESGVDGYAAGALRFPNGILASFACGISVQCDNAAYICGEEGYIKVPVPWKPPVNQARYLIAALPPPRQDPGPRVPAPPREFEVDAHLPLYALEADDFAAAVFDGAAPAVSMQDSIGNMRLLDELRRQVGVPVP